MHGATHVPVLAAEVMAILRPQPGETVCDATLGLGGHARLFAQAVGREGAIIALDADAENIALARERLAGAGAPLSVHHANFREIGRLGLPPLDVLFADLGLSSAHVDIPERGFSFRTDGPLDLRFDRTRGATAADLLAAWSVDDIAEVLRVCGEVRGAGSIARVIARERPTTTGALRRCVEDAAGWRAPGLMAQVFQALRIAVNDELGALEHLLRDGIALLRPGGRAGIITFHSLEDRMVKRAFRSLCVPERHPETGADLAPAPFRLLTRKPVTPSAEETAANPRARSAKFRAIARDSQS